MRLLTFKFLREPKTFHIRLPSRLNSALLTSLSILIYTTFSYAAQVTLEWNANTEQDLSGYIIYQGTSSKDYDASMDVAKWTSATISKLEDNETYYFAVTAYDTEGNESGYSNEVCINCQTSGGGGG
jgi:fibronectin type 3 domain-containing protein